MDKISIEEVLRHIAIRLDRLIYEPRLQIEHSPAAIEILRDILIELRFLQNRVASELSSLDSDPAIAPFTAQFSDVVAVLDRFVTQLDRASPAPSDAAQRVARLRQEISMMIGRLQELRGGPEAGQMEPETSLVPRRKLVSSVTPDAEDRQNTLSREPGHVISFQERKAQILADQIAKLTEEYAACAKARTMTIDPSEELRLQRKMDDLEQKIKAKDQEIVGRDRSSTSRTPLPSLLSPAMTPSNKTDEIRAAKLRRLDVLRLQQAQIGIFTPPYITTEIEDLEIELGLRPPPDSTPPQSEPTPGGPGSS